MKLIFALVLAITALSAQQQKRPESYWTEGLWQGYPGEWTHVSRQVLALAETIPADKYTWRPELGVRSFSEVFMHIAVANFGLLAATGPRPPAGLRADMEKTVTDKAQVIDWLTRSFDAVKAARSVVKHEDFAKKTKFYGNEGTIDGMYMRIIVHANEHMGQLIAYARMAGAAPPWSAKAANKRDNYNWSDETSVCDR